MAVAVTVAVLNVSSVSIKQSVVMLCPTQLHINSSYYSSYNACVSCNARAVILYTAQKQDLQGLNQENFSGASICKLIDTRMGFKRVAWEFCAFSF